MSNAIKIFKRIVILYFSSIVTFILISKLFGESIVYILKSRGVYFIPLFLILVGQFIGFVCDLALERPHLKQKNFNITYLIAFLGFVSTTFYFKYSSWLHKRNFGNIEANQDYFKYYGGQYVTEEKVAFDSLSKILVDPNSFKLTGGNVNDIDTILKGHKQTILIVTLHYEKENHGATMKAQFAVLNNSAKLINYDIPLDKDEIYRIDRLKNTVIKNFNDAMKIVPDSLKKEIRKDFGEIMDK